MPPVICLNEFVDAMDRITEQNRMFLNIRTGQFVMHSCDDMMASENTKATKAGQEMNSDDFRELPDQFDRHDYAIMQRFCHSIADNELRLGLLRRMQGRGASMRIMNMVHDFGILKEWTAFRNEAFRKIASEWLTKHEVPFTG